MIRIKMPFQFKIYLLIIILFIPLINLIVNRVNIIVSTRIMEDEKATFKGLKTVFYNLLNTKIDIIRKEAQLHAGQKHVRQSLAMLEEGNLLESFLVLSFPEVDKRDLIIVTDQHGKVVDGKIALNPEGNKNAKVYKDSSKIQEFIDTYGRIDNVIKGSEIVDYLLVEENFPFSLFVTASAPVWDLERKDQIIGTVSIGFPVNEDLARDLRSGSRYHLGFLLGSKMITSSLEKIHSVDFRNFWNQISQERKHSLLFEPDVISLFNERYLAYASPLPFSERRQGTYLILSPLEERYRFLSQLKSTIYQVSIIILCLTLLIGYFLARGVTAPIKYLADTVSRIADGDYSVNASVKTGDELELLGNEINHMSKTLEERLEEIHSYVAEIEEWNRELEEKVKERTHDMEEKNFRLRMISEELGRAYAQIDDELKTIGELQKNLLPKPALDRDEVSIRCFYLPNGRTGGDYYDFFTLGDHEMFLLIADVSGHGSPAAFIMGITRSITHTLIEKKSAPGKILTTLSNTLASTIRSGEFVTMFLARLDLEEMVLTYSVAGHPPPILYSAERETLTELEVNRGLPLGILENHPYEEICVKLKSRDRLFLYTDGIIEACNDDKQPYGINRLKNVIEKYRDSTPKDLLDMIMEELEQYVQRPLDVEPLEDDVTLMALDVKKVASEAEYSTLEDSTVAINPGSHS